MILEIKGSSDIGLWFEGLVLDPFLKKVSTLQSYKSRENFLNW